MRPKLDCSKKPAWEITAAVDRPGRRALTRRFAASSKQKPLPAGEGGLQGRVRASAAAAPARDQRMEELIGEISDLKKSFRTLSKVIPAKSDLIGGVFAELIGQGIDHDVADQIRVHGISRKSRAGGIAGEHSWNDCATTHHRTTCRVASEVENGHGLCGFDRRGKTTTIAKIAGHAAIRMKKKVALISTDMFRIGGHEHLSRFGELLNIPTYGCPDVDTLKDLVASLDDRDLILIDTPGSSPSDMARLAKLETVTSATNAKVHLVISATTRSEDITKIIIRFQRFKPNSVILTKLDETDSKGPLTGDLLRNEVPVSYITNGQRVPEDLWIPSAEDLARYVLPVETAI